MYYAYLSDSMYTVSTVSTVNEVVNRSSGGIDSDPLIYDYRINIISRAEHKSAAQQQMRLHYQHSNIQLSPTFE